MIIAKYKFNPSTYANLLPEFNSSFTSYTKSDVNNDDGTITRTLESDSLPTRMIFGEASSEATDRSNSLLEILDMNTSNFTSMYNMFRYCTNLTSITCNWNTSKVTTMESAFINCRSLTTLDVSNWDTSQVTNMQNMFRDCRSLTTLDVSNWDTSKVTTMRFLFLDCYSLTSLNTSNWNTSQVTNMGYMFKGCSKLISLDLNNWDTSNVTNMIAMFSNCQSLVSLDVSNFDTSKVTDIFAMFDNCLTLTKLDVNNFNTSKVTNMKSMFNACDKLTKLDLSNFDTSRVTDMSNMFRSCSSLTTLDLNNWNTSKVVNMNGIFYDCSSLTTLDLNNWDTSKVVNMGVMFYNCQSLISLDVSNWDTSQVTYMGNMFTSCSSLIQLDVSNFDTSKVTDMFAMFNNCLTLTKLDVNNFNTSKVTNMKSMFNACDKLTKLDLSNFDTSRVTDMSSMFQNCSKLTSLDISNFNTINVTDTKNMFGYCSSLRKVALRYANKTTLSTIHENLQDRSSTTKGYILSPISLTLSKNWEILKTNYNEFYLPQPLRKVGDVKDKFYWDYDKGHYCIEQNLAKVIFDGSDDEGWMKNAFTSGTDARNCYCAIEAKVYPTYSMSSSDVLFDKLTWRNANSWGDTSSYIEDEFLISGNKLYIFKSSIKTLDEFKQWISQNPVTLIHPLETPIIIDLPEMNKKFSFDNYLPNTSIDVTNLPLQPYGLLLEDDTIRYKATIEPSTLYTIQFNCIAKSTTNLTLDLGGSRVTVDPIIGVNHVQITTPSVLTSDRLFLIGTGIIVNEVIVNKGDMNQYTKYFDGEQSVGELQEDGSYIIRISTDNYTNLWEGDL